MPPLVWNGHYILSLTLLPFGAMLRSCHVSTKTGRIWFNIFPMTDRKRLPDTQNLWRVLNCKRRHAIMINARIWKYNTVRVCTRNCVRMVRFQWTLDTQPFNILWAFTQINLWFYNSKGSCLSNWLLVSKYDNCALWSHPMETVIWIHVHVMLFKFFLRNYLACM